MSLRGSPIVGIALLGAACFLPEVTEAPPADAAALCLTCAAAECDAANNTCMANDACASLVQCVLACPEGDPACSGGCLAGSDDGLDDATAWLDCTSVACPSECPQM